MSYPTPQAAPDPDELLMGSSRAGRSLAFPTIGTWHRDVVVLTPPETQQARDPETGDPKFYKVKGTRDDDLTAPVWQIVIKVQTEYRDADPDKVPDDDGVRYLYVSGSKQPESKSLWVAMAAAVRAAGAKKILPGGRISVGYVADGPKSPQATAAMRRPKQYEASYVAPPAGYRPPTTEGFSGGVPLPDEPDDTEPPF